MTTYQNVLTALPQQPKTWLITGVSGFIGTTLLETLLKLDQQMVVLDNSATAQQSSLDVAHGLVYPDQWSRYSFIDGDICNLGQSRPCHINEGINLAMPWYLANISVRS